MSESRLTDVPIFAVGTHRGKEYTHAHLDEMVGNFERFSTGEKPLLRPPGVLGHEEDQELLRRSDLPAAAWVSGLRRKGDQLLADFSDVPQQVMHLLRGRRYRHVSAEVYDQPPEGLSGGKGKCLRRVAFLGGDVPQIKSLGDIPLPEAHSERFDGGRATVLRFTNITPLPGGCFAVFSEITPMNRDELLKKLAALGMDAALITDAVPDPLLAEIVRVCDGAKAAAQATASGQGAADHDEMLGRMGKMAEEAPEPKDDEEKGKFRERAKKFVEHARKYAAKCGYTEEPPVPPAKKPEGEPAKMSETQIAALVQKAVDDALKASVQGSLGELQKFREETIAGEKTRAVDAFVERMSAAGKLPKVEKETVRRRLLRADTRTVHKFSEGGKTHQGTELDLQMAEIEARPSCFGEKFAQPTTSKGGEDAEVEKIRENFEAYSEQWATAGMTAELLVEGYKAQRKTKPKLTAEEYLEL